MDDKAKERARKLLALAKQGAGGEQQNAETMLRDLLGKHGLTLEDFASDSEALVDLRIEIKKEENRALFNQVVAQVLDTHDLPLYCVRGKPHFVVIKDVTAAQRAEILVRFDIYRAALDAEVKAIRHAFLIKNEIWAASVKGKTVDELTPEEKRALELSRAAKRVSINQQIEAKK